MVGDLLRDFELTAVLQIRRDAGRAESMIADARFDAGRFRTPADDAVRVLLEEGIGGKLTGLAAGAPEEIAVDVIGDAGRFDIIVETLIKTMVAGNVVFPAAFFVQPDPTAAALDKIVANLHLNDGADPGEAVDHHCDQSAVPQAEKIRLVGRLWILGSFLSSGNALEQRMGLLRRQDRRLAFLDRVARASNRMRRISFNNMPGHQPVEEDANRRQVLFDGRR